MGSFVNQVGVLFGGGENNAQFTGQGVPIAAPATADQYTQALGASQAAAAQAQGGLGQQQALISALNAQNGIGNQTQVFNQLQGVANGTGPNPAQAMLANASGQNAAQQAALMGSQRGSSANVGLLGRQAAMQGGAIQQNASGQAAALQAQQSLGALGQMGGMANQQAGNQIGAVGNYNQFAQNQQQLAQAQQQALGNQINAQNTSNVGMQSNLNNVNQGMAGINANNAAHATSGLLSGVAGALTPKGMGSNLMGGGGAGGTAMAGESSLAAMPIAYQGGSVGRSEITPPKRDYPDHLRHIHGMYHGGAVQDFRSGGTVPGEPEVHRDSPRNDVVTARLSPKEIVLPLSVTESENAPEAAAQFVANVLREKGGSSKGSESDFKAALKRAIAGRKAA